MTSPIRPHSTISVTANAARHRRASGTLLSGASSRKFAALTSLFILSPFRPLSINTCVHHPCIPGSDHKQVGSGKSLPVSSINATSSDRHSPGSTDTPSPKPPRIPLRYALLVTTKSLCRSRKSGESLREAETVRSDNQTRRNHLNATGNTRRRRPSAISTTFRKTLRFPVLFLLLTTSANLSAASSSTRSARTR